MFQKKIKVIGLIFAILFVGLQVSVAVANPLGIATFLFSFFTSRPEKVVTSKGSFEVRLTVPAQYREQMNGLKYIYARPMKLDGERDGGGFNFIVPQGWEVEVTAWFPTEGQKPKRGYYNFDNVLYGKLDAPYKYNLNTSDIENSHLLEMGVDIGGKGGGSVNLTYRAQSLSNMYREWLTETDNAMGQLTAQAYQADVQQSQGIEATNLLVVIQSGRNSNVPTSATIEVADASGAVHQGAIMGSKLVPVIPGTVQVYLAPGQEFAGELRVNGIAMPLKAGACNVPAGADAQLVLWPKN